MVEADGVVARQNRDAAVMTQPVGREEGLKYFLEGKSLLNSGDYADAIRSLEIAVKSEPSKADWHYLYARALYNNNQIEDALAATSSIISDHDPKASWHGLAGDCSRRLGNLQDARRHYQLACAAGGGTLPWGIKLATMLIQMGDTTEAHDLTQSLVSSHGKSAELEFLLAQIFAAKQQEAVALDHVREAIALSPRPPERWVLMKIDLQSKLAQAGSAVVAAFDRSQRSDSIAKDAGNYKSLEARSIHPLISQINQNNERNFKTRSKFLTIPKVIFIVNIFIGMLLSFYFCLYASDQYISQLWFAVRSQNTESASPPTSGVALSSLGLSSPMLLAQDSNILYNYVSSPEIVRSINRNVDLRSIFSRSNADYFSRLKAGASDEILYQYWVSRVVPKIDMATGIIKISVSSFDPQDAYVIAQQVRQSCEHLINSISEDSREKTLKTAAQELKNAETRLRNSQLAIYDFQNKHGSIDPGLNAQSQAGLIAKLEQSLAEGEANLKASLSVTPMMPNAQSINANLEALRRQIAVERQKLAGKDNSKTSQTTSSLLLEYQTLLLDKNFADQIYLAASNAVDNARRNAAQTQRYLAVFVEPAVPQDPLGPERLRNTALSWLACFISALLLSTAYGIVREHTR